ncbi:MAG: orotidine-5'-phosphate decarboxylase [Candidatus Omnitrophota bacterium]
MRVNPQDRLIVALDVADFKTAKELVRILAPAVKLFKVGSQLFTACGPNILEFIKKKKAEFFLDLKFHDIPNTVHLAVQAACRYNPAMLTVHTLGGVNMLRAAVEAVRRSSTRTKILGVTVLTSMDENQLSEVGIPAAVQEEVLTLARMAVQAGLDGVVASPREINMLRCGIEKKFIIVTPGIRPADAPPDDQKRTMSAQDTIAQGADYLVVGRPITQAKDPFGAAQKIISEITIALPCEK